MKPKVLLLDESLGALDLKLKKQMQVELKKIQKKLGMTFVYVTHNQEEALTMSDRIVVIDRGKIEQVDSPANIYKYPKSLFVADFIGESNILKGNIFEISDKYAKVDVGDNILIDIVNNGYKVGDAVILIIRPKDIRLSLNNTKSSFEGIVTENIYNGEVTKFVVSISSNCSLMVSDMNDVMYEYGTRVFVRFDINDLIVLGDKNEKRK